MCELFGLTGPDEIVVNEYLETFAGHSVNHPNGWGLAIFCGKEVNIEKEPVAAYKSSYLKERLRTPLRASNMMAHIRFATRGHMSYENCHPFVRHDQSGRASGSCSTSSTGSTRRLKSWGGSSKTASALT